MGSHLHIDVLVSIFVWRIIRPRKQENQIRLFFFVSLLVYTRDLRRERESLSVPRFIHLLWTISCRVPFFCYFILFYFIFGSGEEKLRLHTMESTTWKLERDSNIHRRGISALIKSRMWVSLLRRSRIFFSFSSPLKEKGKRENLCVRHFSYFPASLSRLLQRSRKIRAWKEDEETHSTMSRNSNKIKRNDLTWLPPPHKLGHDNLARASDFPPQALLAASGSSLKKKNKIKINKRTRLFFAPTVVCACGISTCLPLGGEGLMEAGCVSDRTRRRGVTHPLLRSLRTAQLPRLAGPDAGLLKMPKRIWSVKTRL